MSENENETTHDSSDSVEDQLTEISEFEHKIRLLRWGMVVGTLLIIALGVINIINKVQRAAEPVGQIVKGRTLPFNLATTIIPGSIKTDFTGSISNIKKNPQITGKFKVNGRSFGNLISATLGGMQPPELFARPFNAQAKVFLDRDILKFKESGSKRKFT